MGEGKAWSLPWGEAASTIQKLMVHRREFILQLFFHHHPDVPQISLMLHIWQRGADTLGGREEEGCEEDCSLFSK